MAMVDNQRGWTITLVPHAKMRTVALDNPDYRSHLTVSPEDPPDLGFLKVTWVGEIHLLYDPY
jgi:hypothetical protein